MRSLLNFRKYVPHALPKRKKTHRGSTPTLQCALLFAFIPWAGGFCPYLNHLRNLSNFFNFYNF